MDTLNGKMITLARDWRELTQAELAEAASVAQGTISKIERGESCAPDDVVDRLATALRFPREFFFQDVDVQDLPQTYYRRRLTNVSQKTLKAARARWAMTLRGLRILLEAVDVPECKVPRIDLAQRCMDPESAAQWLRREWNVPIGPVQNVTALVEKMGVLVVSFDFGTGRLDGMSIFKPEFGLPPVVFVNKDMPGDRQRFTILHELCHVCCHAHLVGESDNDRNLEHEADVFASEFLMPSEQIIGHLAGFRLSSLPGLKVHWKASMAALLMKAGTLQVLSDAQKSNLWREFSRRGWRKEPDTVPRETPEIVRRIVSLHEQHLGYSEAELSSILGHIGTENLRALYPVAKPTGLRLVNGPT